MSLKRYDLMVPEDFKYGQEIGIALASQFDQGFEEGARHFHPGTKEELTSVKDVLKCVSENECIVVWHPRMGQDTIGLTVFKDGQPQGHKVPMHPEIEKILFPKKENKLKGDI